MQWTVRLEATTSAGEVKSTELVTLSRPAIVGTLAEIGLVLAETKALLARLQASMLCGQVAEGTVLLWRVHGLSPLLRFCAGDGWPLSDRPELTNLASGTHKWTKLEQI